MAEYVNAKQIIEVPMYTALSAECDDHIWYWVDKSLSVLADCIAGVATDKKVVLYDVEVKFFKFDASDMSSDLFVSAYFNVSGTRSNKLTKKEKSTISNLFNTSFPITPTILVTINNELGQFAFDSYCTFEDDQVWVRHTMKLEAM